MRDSSLLARYQRGVKRRLIRYKCWKLYRKSPKPLADDKRIHVTLSFDYEGRWAREGQEENSRKGIEGILAILKLANLRATFNVVGNLAINNMAILRNIVAAGHEIASHTVGHTVVERFSADQVYNDMEEFRDLLSDLAPQLIGFRSPKSRWSNPTLKGLIRAGVLWNAEDDILPFPYVIASYNGRRLWRMPVFCDDWMFEEKGFEPKEMLSIWEKTVFSALQNRRYLAIGFHPWVLGKDEARLEAFAGLVDLLGRLKGVVITPFGDVARYCESRVGKV